MHLIDGLYNDEGAFVQRNVAAGVPGTLITADWLNAVQDELAAVIAAAGLALDKADNAQLHAAILALIAANPPELVPPAGHNRGIAYGLKSGTTDTLEFEGGEIDIAGTNYSISAGLERQWASLSGGLLYHLYAAPPSGTMLTATDIAAEQDGVADPVWSTDYAGWYHPTNTTWRWIGCMYTGSGGAIHDQRRTRDGWLRLLEADALVPANNLQMSQWLDVVVALGVPTAFGSIEIEAGVRAYRASGACGIAIWPGVDASSGAQAINLADNSGDEATRDALIHTHCSPTGNLVFQGNSPLLTVRITALRLPL